MKYELNQIVHYMKDNKPHSAPVLARCKVENLHPEWNANKEQRELFTPFGGSGTKYATCHGLFDEADLHESKAAMVAAITQAV